MSYSRYNRGPRQRKYKNEEELFKALEKKCYKAVHKCSARIPQSLLDEARIHCGPEDYDSFVKYGFIKGSESWTDEDIEEWVRETWLRIYSPYDCTGKCFTYDIHWHRNPNGVVSYVHQMGVDV